MSDQLRRSDGGDGGRLRSARRLVFQVLAAFVLALGPTGVQAPLRAAAAIDCVTYYCASLYVRFTGAGFARAVDDQGQIDCYYNAGSYSGTCQGEYYWIGQMSSTLTVNVTVTASAN